ncbi:MAG: PGF-pre-PGF domain-containing protein [Methanomicrobiaceae archaeon]|nr:PGF-pre-PGF domain-containing protein [Methanomicrobiaceae archaeon]MDD5420420.1 PGF-pre-PGF domain-containing protein [Methanomicrobiaceae archaeon]
MSLHIGNILVILCIGIACAAAIAVPASAVITADGCGGGTHRDAAGFADSNGTGLSAADQSAIDRIVLPGADMQGIQIPAEGTTLPRGLPAPGGEIYRYVELIPEGPPGDAGAGATLEFSVSFSWMERHGCAAGGIVLLRFHDGAWRELPTVFMEEEGGRARYRAVSPGFSSFVIVYDKNETAVHRETPDPAGDADETDAATAPSATQAALVYAPFLGLPAFLLLRRRR